MVASSQRRALAGGRCRRALSGPRWRQWLGPLAGTHWLRMPPCHLFMPFPPFCVRDPDCGDQASLSTSAGCVRWESVTLLSAACISHHTGVHALVQSLLLVASAAVLVLAFVSVMQWRSASRWRPSLPLFFSLRWWSFEAFPPHLKPLPFRSRLLRWSCYHSHEMQLLAWFFHLPATLLP